MDKIVLLLLGLAGFIVFCIRPQGSVSTIVWGVVILGLSTLAVIVHLTAIAIC